MSIQYTENPFKFSSATNTQAPQLGFGAENITPNLLFHDNEKCEGGPSAASIKVPINSLDFSPFLQSSKSNSCALTAFAENIYQFPTINRNDVYEKLGLSEEDTKELEMLRSSDVKKFIEKIKGFIYAYSQKNSIDPIDIEKIAQSLSVALVIIEKKDGKELTKYVSLFEEIIQSKDYRCLTSGLILNLAEKAGLLKKNCENSFFISFDAGTLVRAQEVLFELFKVLEDIDKLGNSQKNVASFEKTNHLPWFDNFIEHGVFSYETALSSFKDSKNAFCEFIDSFITPELEMYPVAIIENRVLKVDKVNRFIFNGELYTRKKHRCRWILCSSCPYWRGNRWGI